MCSGRLCASGARRSTLAAQSTCKLSDLELGTPGEEDDDGNLIGLPQRAGTETMNPARVCLGLLAQAVASV